MSDDAGRVAYGYLVHAVRKEVDMNGKRVVVVGASALGCEFALLARAAGFEVTLIDEHPQAIKNMSFDAPYYYGSGLPAALADDSANFDNVLASNDLLLECVDAEIDVKVATIAWAIFRNGPNAQNVGSAKVAVVSTEGNDMIEYDHLILATGSRDFVPSFAGWDLPGIFGGKAGTKLLSAYQTFEATRTVVLGSSPLAVDFARQARSRGVDVVGLVEPTATFQSSRDDAAWLESQGIGVFYETIIARALGSSSVVGAYLVSTSPESLEVEVKCDSICVAIAVLPNIELAAAAGCDLTFSDDQGTWVPSVTEGLETSLADIYWLSKFNNQDGQIQTILEAISDAPVDRAATARNVETPQHHAAEYITTWVSKLNELGDNDVIICQCEGVTRSEFLTLQPPRYLKSSLRSPKSLVRQGENGATINQDQLKRLTRVGMGHCQGKRCRDEAVFLLNQRFGVALKAVKPATYRFPVRPVDMSLIVADDETEDLRENWPYWVHSGQ
ncbi:FAD-dependent oxidoreductase [Mesorhizobium sp. 43Arga]